jgi:hypothetical protein
MVGAEPSRRGAGQDGVVDGPSACLAPPVGALIEKGEGALHIGELLLDRVQHGTVNVHVDCGRARVDARSVEAGSRARVSHGVRIASAEFVLHGGDGTGRWRRGARRYARRLAP